MPLQDANRVEAALRATSPSKHGAAESVVVLEGGGALWVGRADPFGRGASDDGVGARRVDHFGAALLHVSLGGLALLVALAVALKRKRKTRLTIETKILEETKNAVNSPVAAGDDVRRLCGNLLGRQKSIPMTLNGKLDRSAG